MKPILIVDDEAPIRALIRLTLERAGYTCDEAATGTEAADKIEANTYDLALLDIMLPGPDGYELLDYLRSVQTPVIFLTAKTAVADRVRGLHLGADDYIPKPFGMMELIARIRAVLRRTEDMQDKDESRPLVAGGICVDERAHTVFVNEQEVQLTLKEYQLLCLLMKNRGAVLTRDVLLENIWGYNNESETRTVDVHIRTLRQKLGADGALIETVRGVGYRMGEHT